MFRRDKAVALLVGSKYVSNGPPPLPSSKRETEGAVSFQIRPSPSLTRNARRRGTSNHPDPLPRSKSETEGPSPSNYAHPPPSLETRDRGGLPATLIPSLARKARRWGRLLPTMPGIPLLRSKRETEGDFQPP